MKKAYSLDYSIERDSDRVQAVSDILDKLDYDPRPTDLEQMASYILYGKDENGQNAIQRGDTISQFKRYNSYKTLDDKVISLDELLENPMVNEQTLKPAYQRNSYKKPVQKICRPKFNRKGELIDKGDSDIPGMIELWDTIDRIDKWIRQLEGRVPADEDTLLFDDSYRLYRLKHNLIDIRRHQYYLKDSYKPTLHFMGIDHPKTQFYDWSGDSFYWISLEEWQKRVNTAYTHKVSKNLNDYETRQNDKGETEVKWVVCEHTFDWENPKHVRALMNNYDNLREYLDDKLDTYGRTLIWDFERYRKLTNFSEIREFLIDHKLNQTPYESILEELEARFGVTYNKNHLCCIMAQEIPKKIAETARRERLLIDTPEDQRKKCPTCGRMLPVTSMFFSRNRSHKDGFASRCKECERQLRVEKGGQSLYDKRGKE